MFMQKNIELKLIVWRESYALYYTTKTSDFAWKKGLPRIRFYPPEWRHIEILVFDWLMMMSLYRNEKRHLANANEIVATKELSF